jgi:hypothetical protein
MGHLAAGVLGLSAGPRGATLDPTGRYRYHLWRSWDTDLPRAVFVGLNPSTADAERDDPTLRRCVAFARSWGCGGLDVVNLFAWRATKPADLKRAAEPIGADNDRILRELAAQAEHRIACWGVHGAWQDRGARVRAAMGPGWQCLGVTRDGHPRHPLYLRRDTPRQPY